MRSEATNFIRAILQGMTGAGLFRRLHYPGEPEEFIGTETADEVRSNPAYQHLAQAVSAAHERALNESQLAAYYSELYRTDTDEHINERTCTTL